MAETDMAGLFAQHQPDDYGGDSIQCQGCHPRRWFAGWREFAAHLASLSDERLAQVEAILSDVTDESAADGYVALADARGNRLSRICAALYGDAAPRRDADRDEETT